MKEYLVDLDRFITDLSIILMNLFQHFCLLFLYIDW